MTKAEIKLKQINVFNQEQKLADATFKLLFDILSSISDEDKEKFIDTSYPVNDYETIVQINSQELETEDNGDFRTYSLEDLTQVQQKEIIDTIILLWGM